MPEHPTDAHFSFTFVFKQALKITLDKFNDFSPVYKAILLTL